MNSTRALWLLVALCAAGPLPATPAGAVPFDNQPKLLLHVLPITSKNACAFGTLGDCRDAIVSGGLTSGETGYQFVYLLVARGSLPSIGGIECGIQYEHGGAGDQPQSGVDVFSWTVCGTLEFPSGGWPSSGAGNMITWSAGNCPTSEVAVVGYFYVAAYSADTMALTVRPVSGLAKVAQCSGAETPLHPRDLGRVVFAACAPGGGCNPCLRDCTVPLP